MDKRPQKKSFACPERASETSWEGVKNWYDRIVGEKGHYFHQKIILPGVSRLLKLDGHSHLLDLGCGQGVLARHIPKEVNYLGIDISPSLIAEAKRYDATPKRRFLVSDVTKPLDLKESFTHACMILCLQNMEDPQGALMNAAKHLAIGGKLLLVLNHPCFRIPRQSSWGDDEQNKSLYRRINRYMTSMKIPIAEKPGREDSQTTFSFHHSLSTLSGWLQKAGFAIHHLEEWCSDKMSTGANAKRENLARDEFPLFLTILSCKL